MCINEEQTYDLLRECQRGLARCRDYTATRSGGYDFLDYVDLFLFDKCVDYDYIVGDWLFKCKIKYDMIEKGVNMTYIEDMLDKGSYLYSSIEHVR